MAKQAEHVENLNVVCPQCGAVGRLVEIRLHMRLQRHPGIRAVEAWARANAVQDKEPA